MTSKLCVQCTDMSRQDKAKQRGGERGEREGGGERREFEAALAFFAAELARSADLSAGEVAARAAARQRAQRAVL